MTERSVVSVVLAAGASTRMRSQKSKLLHEILGRPIVHWAADQAGWSASKIIFVVGHQKEAIEESLRTHSLSKKISFALQSEPKGTGHAVQMAWPEIEKNSKSQTPIFIMGGDAFLLNRETLEDFISQFEESKAVMSLMTYRLTDPAAYGRIVRNSQGVVERIVEKKDATEEELRINEVNAGFYLVRGGILQEALKSLKNKNKAGEFYLTDLVGFCRKASHLVSTYEIPAEEGLGINTQEELSWVEKILQRRINSFWMAQGVRMQSPESIWIDSDVQLSPDVTLEPGVILKGKTRIESEVLIRAYSVVHDSTIGRGSDIGPFARLRPGSILDEKVHIGNFVEVKKSHLRKGVKAGHLTYLGDAEIDVESNIGAGTITCNYDGFQKHQTKIGREVFIGSNTSLVAPVSVGDGAIVGAGSVISKNVQAQSIAIERSDQRELKDAASRFRSKRVKK